MDGELRELARPASLGASALLPCSLALHLGPARRGRNGRVRPGSDTGRRPEQIVFGADSGNVVTGIAWSAWTADGATGYGRSGLGICLPPTETWAGSATTYAYSASWPVSASAA